MMKIMYENKIKEFESEFVWVIVLSVMKGELGCVDNYWDVEEEFDYERAYEFICVCDDVDVKCLVNIKC